MKNTAKVMKKNRLQQQTLDRFFKPSTAPPRQPLPTASAAAHPTLHEVVDVDEEAMNEVLHSSAPTPVTAAQRDQWWRIGQQEVIFPWSPLNTRAGTNGERYHVWDRIHKILDEPFRVASSEDFCSLLAALDQLVDGPGNGFVPLRRAIGKMPTSEQTHLFDAVLPWMKETVLRAPALFRCRTVPLLVQGQTQRLVFSHEEVVTLLCCCFFSLFPSRSEAKKSAGRRGEETRESTPPPQPSTPSSSTGGGGRTMWPSRKLPCCNFSSLFSCGAVGRDAALDNKIRAVIEYFFCCHRHHSNPLSVAHQRCLELTRASCATFPRFEDSTQPLTPVQMRRTGGIEEDAGALQVDFANRFVGGGVLRSGCVQEEIRMALAPEMILSRLVCEELTESEVLFMSGAPDFCTATGYAERFRFLQGCDPWATPGDEEDSRSNAHRLVLPLVPAHVTHPRTQEPMLMHDVCVLAMDARNFRVQGRPSDQYQPHYLRRELHKAYVGFGGVPESFAALPAVRTGAIATGHWGCGAFRGDKELKLLLQWCAAAEAGGRVLHYYTFDTPLREFDDLQRAVLAASWTVGTMTRALLRYAEYRSKVPEGEAMRPFQFVAQVCSTTN